MTDRTIPELVALVKSASDDQTQLDAARELHRRGVSIVGIIPTSVKPVATPRRGLDTFSVQ